MQAPQKFGWGCTAAARRGRAVHKSFRIEIIGVNKAGIEHPRIEAGGEAIARQWRAMRSGRRYLLFPTIARRELLFQTPQKCARPLRVGLRAAIWQAAVVPGYGKGYLRLPGIERDLGPGSGVVDFGPALQTLLESVAVFPDIVQQPGQVSLLLPAKRPGKSFGQGGRTKQMVANALGSLSVSGNVCQKRGWLRGTFHDVDVAPYHLLHCGLLQHQGGLTMENLFIIIPQPRRHKADF